MNKTVLVGLLASAFCFAVPDRAEAQSIDPLRSGLLGIGVNNAPGGLSDPGAPGSGVIPLASAKYYLSTDAAVTGDFGLVLETGDQNGRALIFGGGYEIVLKRYGSGRFYGRGAGHFKNADEFAGDGTTVNLFGGAGFEYILSSGLPGLGLSLEYGVNFTMYFPASDDQDTTTRFQVGGINTQNLTSAFGMAIRYYFL